MKVKIEILGLLHINGFKKNEPFELPQDSTITDLYKALGIIKDHQKFIIPFINDIEVKKNTLVKDKDKVKLFLPTGGG